MAKEKYKYGDLLLVSWKDIVSDVSWSSMESASALLPADCKSVGWFLNEDKEVIRIFSHVNDLHCSDYTVIPKGVIVKIIRILKAGE